MVSRKQHELITRSVLWLTAFAVTGALGQQGFAESPGKKFYADDPLRREPPPRPVSGIKPRTVDHVFDFLDSSYATPRREGKIAGHAPQPALDVNTVGEVLESAWYTNRHAFHRTSIAEIQRGPGNSAPPDPSRPWRITAAKSNGITPGFVIEDGRKNRYVLKFDPPLYPELCSAADVIGSKLFYALGYSTPENYIVHFRREQLEITEGVTYRHPSGKKIPLTGQIVDELLQAQPKSDDGTYRALASRWLEGKVVGPFNYRGVRTDDPNDTIPHQNRRVLRGLAVFAAWVNHHDTSQINTMDTLVTEDGRQYLKHYLIDFGSILGSRGDRPKEPWIGHQYTIVHREAALRALSLGFYVPRWDRSQYPKLRGVGVFDAWSFEPLKWRPEVPNPAFLMMDDEDAFWAAKQVASFSDEEIRALVETGEYSDPRAAKWVSDCLIKRRDKIAAAWFSKVLPLDGFRVTDGELVFEDLGARYRSREAREYAISWDSLDADGRATPTPEAKGSRLPDFRGDIHYLAATIKPAGGPEGDHPVTVYVRQGQAGPEVVGIDRK
jgi:hypothetical protein